MRVFRIAKTAYAGDLTGEGARLYGGRWNRPGTAIIYTSESRSLATVEYLVHVPAAFAPADLSIAAIEVPGDVEIEEVSAADLPANWRGFPAPSQLADLGTAWARERRSLLLRVPSAVVPEEHNILINPSHPDMHRVVVAAVEGYAFDERLLRQ